MQATVSAADSCTVYNGCFRDGDFQRLASTAKMVFNDVILRVGIELGLSIIDLRFVCSSPVDYANPIKPSSLGGAKIARAVVRALLAGNTENAGARVVISQCLSHSKLRSQAIRAHGLASICCRKGARWHLIIVWKSRRSSRRNTV